MADSVHFCIKRVQKKKDGARVWQTRTYEQSSSTVVEHNNRVCIGACARVEKADRYRVVATAEV